MNQRANAPGDRLPLLISIGVFVVMLACLPVAMMLDDGIDRDRPMYQDMLRMQGLQGQQVASGAAPVAVEVADGEAVEVAGQEFIASPGVTVVVRVVDADSYCIRVRNDRGQESSERCSA